MDRRMTKQQTEELYSIMRGTDTYWTQVDLEKFLDEYGYRSPSERHSL